MDNLLSVKEAAKRLGDISPWTVRRMLTNGKMQRTKVGGRTMIRESELAKVIREGNKTGLNEARELPPVGPELATF